MKFVDDDDDDDGKHHTMKQCHFWRFIDVDDDNDEDVVQWFNVYLRAD